MTETPPRTLKRKRGRPRTSVMAEVLSPVKDTLLKKQGAGDETIERGKGDDGVVDDVAIEEDEDEDIANGEEEEEEEGEKEGEKQHPPAKRKRAPSRTEDEVQVPDSQALSDQDSVVGDAATATGPASKKPTPVKETVAKARGRPRKSLPAQPAAEPATKRPRGRPRKYANEVERKAVRKHYRETFKARRAALLNQQSERDESSDVEPITGGAANGPIRCIEDALEYAATVGGINEIIPNTRSEVSKSIAHDNTGNDDSLLEYESAHEHHPPPNHVLEQLKEELATMNAKLTSMMDRQKEQEAELNELKRWKENYIFNDAKGKETERESVDNDDDDVESEDGDVVGGSQAPPIPTAHGMTGRPSLPGRPRQVLAAIAARARPSYGKLLPRTTASTTATTATTTASKKHDGGGSAKISNKWSEAARKVYARLADPDVQQTGLGVAELLKIAGLGAKEMEKAVKDLEKHGFIYPTVDADTFALS